MATLLPESPATADLFGYAVSVSGVAAPEVAPGSGVYEAIIGTVDLVGPTNGFTTFTLSDPNPSPTRSDFAGLGPGNSIDDSAINFRSLTLTVVPEPSS